MSITETELRAIIARDEALTVEFKLESEKQQQLAEVLAAMANASGGWLVVGVSDSGKIVGISRPKTVIDRLHAAASMVEPSLISRVSVESIETSEGRTVVVAQVPGGLLSIHSVAGVYRMRVGSYNKLLTFDQAQALAYRRGILHYEQTALPQLQLEDLSPTAIENYLQRRLNNYSPALFKSLSRFQVLNNLGCAVEEEGKQLPTVAGALFFSSAPDFYVPGSQVIAARFGGITSERVLDRATIRGTLPEIIEAAARFIEKNIRHHLQLPSSAGASMSALEVSEYPVAAYREMIVNLVGHRDYYNIVPAHIMIFDDRIVAENPGGLLPGLSVQNLENRHRPRNPRLIEMLHTLGYVERFGSGISRMRHAMQEAGLPSPIFEADESYFRVTLRNAALPEKPVPEQEPVQITSELTHASPVSKSAALSPLRETAILQKLPLLRLKPRQVEGLRHLIRNGRLTNTSYRQATGLAEDASLADLRELLQLDIIQKVGTSGRSVYYILNPEIEKGL
ncbi:MAG TPA: ATP-binding protein [Chloroflexia bacterium]|nr:ATP-binding protein [Chloroflexia bacterium]